MLKSSRTAPARSSLESTQAQTTGRLTRSNAFARSSTNSPSILSFCSSIESLHFHQYFPHCGRSSFRFDHPWRPNHLDASAATSPLLVLQGFPPTDHVGTSAIGLSLVTFSRTKQNIVVQACCGHLPTLFHILQELDNFSSRFFCQLK